MGTDEIIGIEPSATFMPQIKNEVIPAYNLDMKLVTSSTAGDALRAGEGLQQQRAHRVHGLVAALDERRSTTSSTSKTRRTPRPPGTIPSRVTAVVNADLKDDDPRPTPSSRPSRSTRSRSTRWAWRW